MIRNCATRTRTRQDGTGTDRAVNGKERRRAAPRATPDGPGPGGPPAVSGRLDLSRRPSTMQRMSDGTLNCLGS